jgi:Leucine-rich repeat (LRR) protein
MASIGWALLRLLCLAQLHTLAASSVLADGNLTHHSTASSCRPDQANALLKLKKSFKFHYLGSMYDNLLDSITTLPSWQAGTDCCLWEGVGCSNSSGLVTALNLGGFGLYSKGIDPVLFNLTSLRLLDLSMNNFGGEGDYEIPSVGFERLGLLTHLNLSNSGFRGQVPVCISKLTNLVSLDLSNNFHGNMSIQTLVANLSNLRELYLDDVWISSSTAEDCFKALAKSVPRLRVLSLEGCGLKGNIHRSLSRLQSLVIINLSNNPGITPGPFPEFFMNFLNLRVLQLSRINLEGWFPRGMFQSKQLMVLDLSWNLNLTGNMPNFSNATSLETLIIVRTNFSYTKSNYSSNFTALTELGLDGKIISRDFLSSSFGMLPSLRKLVLTRLSLPIELFESVFSWIEGIQNLRSLQLDECDLSMTMPSSIGNLKSLTSLEIFDSNITTQTLSSISNIRSLKFFTIVNCGCSVGKLPPAIGNMTSLEILDVLECQLSGPIPQEIGKLTSLERLDISMCQLSGPIPQEIGALKKLTSLALPFSGLSGRIPSSIGNLTQLTELGLDGNYLSGKVNSLIKLKLISITKSHLLCY